MGRGLASLWLGNSTSPFHSIFKLSRGRPVSRLPKRGGGLLSRAGKCVAQMWEGQPWGKKVSQHFQTRSKPSPKPPANAARGLFSGLHLGVCLAGYPSQLFNSLEVVPKARSPPNGAGACTAAPSQEASFHSRLFTAASLYSFFKTLSRPEVIPETPRPNVVRAAGLCSALETALQTAVLHSLPSHPQGTPLQYGWS